MRPYFFILILLFLLSACERENPSLVETYLSKPYVLGTYEAGAVSLDWSIVSEELMEGGRNRRQIAVERYVLEMSENSPESLTDFQTLSPSTVFYLVEELTNGQAYYFAIRAEGEGKSIRSNVIMLIPRPLPQQQGLVVSDSLTKEATVSLDANFYGSFLGWISNGPFTSFPSVNTALLDSLNGLGTTSLSWSPYHDKLMYAIGKKNSSGDKRGQLGLYSPSENKFLQLTDFEPYYDHQPVWSPDGEWIAYLSDEKAGNEYHIWKIKADASGKQNLTEDQGDLSELVNKSHRSPSQLVFSPQADTLAFERQKPLGDGYVYSLYEVSAYGGGHSILHDSPWNDRKPAYSPSGEQIAFFSDRSGQPEVWVLDRKTSKLMQLSGGKEMPTPILGRGLRWSPDGQQLLYIYLSGAEEKAILISL